MYRYHNTPIFCPTCGHKRINLAPGDFLIGSFKICDKCLNGYKIVGLEKDRNGNEYINTIPEKIDLFDDG